MKSVVCLNGNMPVADTFAPLAKAALRGDPYLKRP